MIDKADSHPFWRKRKADIIARYKDDGEDIETIARSYLISPKTVEMYLRLWGVLDVRTRDS